MGRKKVSRQWREGVVVDGRGRRRVQEQRWLCRWTKMGLSDMMRLLFMVGQKVAEFNRVSKVSLATLRGNLINTRTRPRSPGQSHRHDRKGSSYGTAG